MPAKKQAPKPIALNEEQQAVVSAREGFYQILAGPGAGKSQCLIQRYVDLLSEGKDPGSILSLSFTSAAAKNLRARVEELTGKIAKTREASGALTFHSLALSFAQTERQEFPFELADFPLAAEPAANKMSGDAARRNDIDPRSFRSDLQLYRRQRIRPLEALRVAESKLDAKLIKSAMAYKDYARRCKEAGLLDFDDLIFYMVEILESKPKVRARHKYDWIQIDESQDCSKIEWDLACLVSGKSVLAVGDLSQGIYSFRGSDGELFQKMDEMFVGTRTLYLGCNYRSTPEIVDFIRPFSVSQDLAEKFHTKNEHGPAPIIKGFLTPSEEVAWVVSKVKEK